jgi:hypothetical protein
MRFHPSKTSSLVVRLALLTGIFCTSETLLAEQIITPTVEQGIDKAGIINEKKTAVDALQYYRLGDTDERDPETRYVFGWGLGGLGPSLKDGDRVELVFVIERKFYDPEQLEVLHLSASTSNEIETLDYSDGEIILTEGLRGRNLKSEAKELRVDVTEAIKADFDRGAKLSKFRFQLLFPEWNDDKENDQLYLSRGALQNSSASNSLKGTRLEILPASGFSN